MNAQSETYTQHSGTPAAGQRRFGGGIPQPAEDFLHYLREYARTKPETAACWCFAIGFVLGWKLKPW